MVFLNISVHSIDEAVDFYVNKLGIFSLQLDQRLVCNIGIDLIIDLHQCGSADHSEIFGQDFHVPSSFWASCKVDQDENSPVLILDRLETHHVSYEKIGNLAGVFLHFKDPSGNKFSLHANHGCIK